MACGFVVLYSGADGYVVRCKDCGHFQVAFISSLLVLTPLNYEGLCHQVKILCRQLTGDGDLYKSQVVQTPSQDFSILLNAPELLRFAKVLEEADTEYRTQSLLQLFEGG